MANRAAFAALTIQQQTYIASVIATAATLKGVTLGVVSFSSVMKALGASMMAAGRAVQGFLASIGPVGWIIIGITGAYAALNAVFKVNTKLMKNRWMWSANALNRKRKECPVYKMRQKRPLSSRSDIKSLLSSPIKAPKNRRNSPPYITSCLQDILSL
jgi:hypothetical protein